MSRDRCDRCNTYRDIETGCECPLGVDAWWSCHPGTEADHDARCSRCGRPVWCTPVPPRDRLLCDPCFDQEMQR